MRNVEIEYVAVINRSIGKVFFFFYYFLNFLNARVAFKIVK